MPMAVISFDPRSRMGSDSSIRDQVARSQCRFDPRSRMGERRPDQGQLTFLSLVSDPRSRMGSDDDIDPAASQKHQRMFRSVLPHGERPTGLSAATANSRRVFDPRSRMGSDHGAGAHAREPLDDSIHAPAWGATQPFDHAGVSQLFRSTLPHGERPGSPNRRSASSRFRSTLPHGERRDVGDASDPEPGSKSFDPRSRMGSDTRPSSQALHVLGGEIDSAFRSTLPHGERRMSRKARRVAGVFRSTLPHGERLITCRERASTVPEPVSIHAPARGATVTSIMADGRRWQESFDPRSRMRSDCRT